MAKSGQKHKKSLGSVKRFKRGIGYRLWVMGDGFLDFGFGIADFGLIKFQ